MEWKKSGLIVIALSAMAATACATHSPATTDNGPYSSASGSSSSAAGRTVPTFEQADRNGNRIIDPWEAAAAGLNFHDADLNGDFVINAPEYDAAVRQQLGVMPGSSVSSSTNRRGAGGSSSTSGSYKY